MKNSISIILLLLIVSVAHSQPCKLVKPGMTKNEVLKLVGKPTEIDSLGVDEKAVDGHTGKLEIWQYGEVGKSGNQRVEFIGEKVEGEVVSDGLKMEELMGHLINKEITLDEFNVRMKQMNKENCK